MSGIRLSLFALVLLAVPAAGEEPKEKPAPYQMPAPRGWARETIALPPGFARDMSWKGTEELRFAPGMFKADSDSFFSYAVLFWLPAETKVDGRSLEKEMLIYYRGLAGAVSAGKKRDVDVKTFTLTLKDVTPEKAPKRESGEPYSSFTGELKWIEPFTTGKPQTLRLEVQTWECRKAGRRCVFVCASPKAESAAVWKTLRAIRDGTRCAPEKSE
jgi:hypothetical protein